MHIQLLEAHAAVFVALFLIHLLVYVQCKKVNKTKHFLSFCFHTIFIKNPNIVGTDLLALLKTKRETEKRARDASRTNFRHNVGDGKREPDGVAGGRERGER